MKLCTDSKIFFIEAIYSPIICTDLASQNQNFASNEYEHLKNLNLADKSGDGKKTVENLIRLDYYYQFMTGKIIKGKINEPVALESCFGWILSRRYKNYTAANLNETYFLKINMQIKENFGDTLNSFDKKIEQFLNADYDDYAKEKSKSLFDEFGNNLKHNGSRYEVKLPCTCSKEMIPDNYVLAKIRTEHLLTQSNKNKPLLKKYDDIIKDFLKEGIVKEANNIPEKGRVHYLPHRAVIRNDKETSKTRVVYDASSKVKNEASLNDRLESGPCLLPLLFDILLRFRTGKIGLISDIKQAFLQIEISPEHRDYLRFLWYDDVYKSNPELIILRFA